GGTRDARSQEPWEENTMVMVFSVTKGLAAMTLAVAHSQGYLDYDEKVATYWPEFAQHGKEDITVRQLLAHQAGLILLDETLTIEDIMDPVGLADLLARQEPQWPPGTQVGYHATTLGFYMGELIRRVDPEHRSLGRFFQEEIARPLGLEFYIGLPDSVPDSLVADIYFLSALKTLEQWPRGLMVQLLNPRSRFSRVLQNPRGFQPNQRRYRSLELPSSNGIGQVRSIAKAYGVLAAGGTELNLTGETLAELAAPARPPTQGPYDAIRGMDSYFSLGFEKPGPGIRFGSSRAAYGTSGFGGAFGFADPALELGYAFASNKLGPSKRENPREQACRLAVYRCILRLESPPAPEVPLVADGAVALDVQ
ncbi:MAG: beta-lactamase family protein, partial [Fidelibacterota bacterium]